MCLQARFLWSRGCCCRGSWAWTRSSAALGILLGSARGRQEKTGRPTRQGCAHRGPRWGKQGLHLHRAPGPIAGASGPGFACLRTVWQRSSGQAPRGSTDVVQEPLVHDDVAARGPQQKYVRNKRENVSGWARLGGNARTARERTEMTGRARGRSSKEGNGRDEMRDGLRWVARRKQQVLTGTGRKAPLHISSEHCRRQPTAFLIRNPSPLVFLPILESAPLEHVPAAAVRALCDSTSPFLLLSLSQDRLPPASSSQSASRHTLPGVVLHNLIMLGAFVLTALLAAPAALAANATEWQSRTIYQVRDPFPALPARAPVRADPRVYTSSSRTASRSRTARARRATRRTASTAAARGRASSTSSTTSRAWASTPSGSRPSSRTSRATPARARRSTGACAHTHTSVSRAHTHTALTFPFLPSLLFFSSCDFCWQLLDAGPDVEIGRAHV